MGNCDDKDILIERYGKDVMMLAAEQVLSRDHQSEEAFLGAQCIRLIHGKL